jgi:four helix bundle protein
MRPKKDADTVTGEEREGSSTGFPRRAYDLQERVSKFGEDVIRFVAGLPKSAMTPVLTNQLIRSSTSIAANYMEADCAESARDFRHKIAICRKEAKETVHWLRMLAAASPSMEGRLHELSREARELELILSSILRKASARQ